MNIDFFIIIGNISILFLLVIFFLILKNRKLRRELVNECDYHLETIHALYELRDNYSIALQLQNQILIIWEIELDDLFFTPDFIKLTNYDYPELQNTLKFYCSKIHPDEAQNFFERITEFRKNTSQCFDDTHRLRKKNGEYCWVNFRVAGNTKTNSVLGTLTEITSLKNKELQQVERIDFLEKSLHNIRGEFSKKIEGESSEIILNYILYSNTLSFYLKHSEVNEPSGKLIKKKNIHFELSEAIFVEILKDLQLTLDLDSGRLDIKKTSQNIKHFLRNLQNEIARIKDNHGKERIALLFTDNEDENQCINTDVKLVTKILRAFINNAIESTFNGYVELQYNFDERQNLHNFKISDTGSVILVSKSNALIENLMSRSYRYFPEREPIIALVLAVKLIKLFDGKIAFEKQENLNTVTISIPL